jgi:hypothetical protein
VLPGENRRLFRKTPEKLNHSFQLVFTAVSHRFGRILDRSIHGTARDLLTLPTTRGILRSPEVPRSSFIADLLWADSMDRVAHINGFMIAFRSGRSANSQYLRRWLSSDVFQVSGAVEKPVHFLTPSSHFLLPNSHLHSQDTMADVQAHTARLIALFVSCVLYGLSCFLRSTGNSP